MRSSNGTRQKIAEGQQPEMCTRRQLKRRLLNPTTTKEGGGGRRRHKTCHEVQAVETHPNSQSVSTNSGYEGGGDRSGGLGERSPILTGGAATFGIQGVFREERYQTISI